MMWDIVWVSPQDIFNVLMNVLIYVTNAHTKYIKHLEIMTLRYKIEAIEGTRRDQTHAVLLLS